jgi:ribosome-binding ATPase YchF (GTP1/OBG family)
VTAACGKIEAELAELPREEQREYLASYGLTESGLERPSFLTAGEDECRAWTIPMNSNAVKAAGAVHSDFEKKFIRAEVVNWQTLIDLGGYSGARDKGQLRLEGKDTLSRTATCW